jgi:hydroxyethylthiazole kinase-like uncharacterized protein yjeF
MKLPIVSCAEMRRIEESTFSTGVEAEALMEQVGERVARAVQQFLGGHGTAAIYYGKGHNGGDALVAARHLASAGWVVTLHPQEADPARLAPLTAKMLEAYHLLKSPSVGRSPGRWMSPPAAIIDGLLGIGATGPLREDIRALAREINTRRTEGNARVFAVDIPTGLNADTGEADPDCVVADVTVSAGYAKTGLVADGASAHVGRLCVAALDQFAPHAPRDFTAEAATPDSLRGLLPRRNFDSYKNQYGHIGIVAGSEGFLGAAVLCASGALRGGAGLVTVYAPHDIQPLLAIKMPPEIMVQPVASYEEVLEGKHTVLAVGPGLGQSRAGAIVQLVEHATCPMVLDADGLNIVAALDTSLLARCVGPRLLTPHPGEMGRLWPESKKIPRYDAATQFTSRFAGARSPITLLLKGSRTIIHEHGHPASYNTTGNPGMGTGGMGDVLTGVCAALIGQHLAPYDAARLGAWLCGRAAECAVPGMTDESLAALDVVHCLRSAFSQLRARTL